MTKTGSGAGWLAGWLELPPYTDERWQVRFQSGHNKVVGLILRQGGRAPMGGSRLVFLSLMFLSFSLSPPTSLSSLTSIKKTKQNRQQPRIVCFFDHALSKKLLFLYFSCSLKKTTKQVSRPKDYPAFRVCLIAFLWSPLICSTNLCVFNKPAVGAGALIRSKLDVLGRSVPLPVVL